jgi:DNA-binding NarL/FixJ family response regulator
LAGRTVVAEFRLTGRENQIIAMIAVGYTNKDIARRLNIEVSTAKTHMHNLLRKLRLERRGQVAYWAHVNMPGAGENALQG